MGDRHRNLFMIAKDDFRFVVAAVIHDGIMNAAKGRARIEGGVFDIERLHQIDDHVGAVLRLLLFFPALCFSHCYVPPVKFV